MKTLARIIARIVFKLPQVGIFENQTYQAIKMLWIWLVSRFSQWQLVRGRLPKIWNKVKLMGTLRFTFCGQAGFILTICRFTVHIFEMKYCQELNISPWLHFVFLCLSIPTQMHSLPMTIYRTFFPLSSLQQTLFLDVWFFTALITLSFFLHILFLPYACTGSTQIICCPVHDA